MKIQGPNNSRINPYQKQMNKQAEIKKDVQNKEDKLQISDEAKRMQSSEEPSAARQKHVDQIKQSVQSGNYTVDPKLTAQKLLNFWNNQG
ncbi:flagellar biosynthesis anti-sigma factor FlgM [Aquibacillus koreensis]|uniref:Negative regulator of flagellin synthesis n=1 Tax=Aquibacillus koreensis TaxID=279446 RepID=A0A9X4AKP0_9BACI|nr:flagellar biosynthesis anti-sigma factor FlgM [Aquibacillus koreensis]MCT2537250.1 flagellar biosynthesis anti-sigma factor FlgM [Aquibacillus koreensis]MDC3421598.1 flagellar biosynthesis anti-sigma factor FlgM [Aquibacillus koreensis]